ncbi:MAG TPA: nuclear transport factor 2 family protein [Acidimicrobiales bacterium]|jgi:hypothetical protein
MFTRRRLTALEQRVAQLEDQLEVMRVIAAYAPSVDGGAADQAPLLWTEGCVYDSDADDPLTGREAIAALSRRIGELPFGAAHFIAPPVVVVTGDSATVTGESHTFHQEEGRYVVGRVSANRWELTKAGGRWQVRSRVNRILDGTAPGRELLARGIGEWMA